MCGICLTLWIGNSAPSCSDRDQIHDTVCSSRLLRRGPDAFSTQWHHLGSNQSLWGGCTLHFRGSLTLQPLEDEKDNLLLWNGEIFGNLEVGEKENDGQVLLKRLSGAATYTDILETLSHLQGPYAFIFWNHHQGELWFGRDYFGRRSLLIQVDNDRSTLALASVRLGEKDGWAELPAKGIYCLRFGQGKTGSDCKSEKSVLCVYPWQWQSVTNKMENINKIHTGEPTSDAGEACKPGEGTESSLLEDMATLNLGDVVNICISRSCITPSFQPFNLSLPDKDFIDNIDKQAQTKGSLSDIAMAEQLSLAEQFVHVLGESVRVRVECQSNLCSRCIQQSLSINPSLDGSSLNSFMESAKLIKKQTSENDEDLLDISVAKCDPDFGNPGADDAEKSLPDTTLSSNIGDHRSSLPEEIYERTKRKSGTCRDKDESAAGDDVLPSPHIPGSIDDKLLCQGFTAHTTISKTKHNSQNHAGVAQDHTGVVQDRHNTQDYSTVPQDLTHASFNKSNSCGHARVAVLFSGGVDSLVIAALTDRYVPQGEPIDLINVAFEQTTDTANRKQSSKPHSGCKQTHFDVPDRQTGVSGLKVLNPERDWRFVQVNVTKAELQKARLNHVRDLIYPLTSVLDDSIGCAIWFASRGQGYVSDPKTGDLVPYTSTARVLLLGMGADEQLAGYSRHRVKFSCGGWQALVEELQMEIQRISARNLGRDDRIISDHGKEARFPFLDENVVSFLNQLPVWMKTNLHLPRGIGEKFLLRMIASQLGLGQSAVLPKRAIQFGSRIAKMENKKEKASDRCDRLTENR